MTMFETVGEKRRALKIMALSGLSSLAILAGCGDDGSSTISACPDGLSDGQSPITKKKDEWKNAINNGVAELRFRISDDVWAKYDGQKRIDLIEDEDVREAAKDIFHTVDGNSLFLDVGSYTDAGTETKLDDMSEVFCRENGEVYLSPEAQNGIFELRNAGINVDLVPDYLQPEDQRISAGR